MSNSEFRDAPPGFRPDWAFASDARPRGLDTLDEARASLDKASVAHVSRDARVGGGVRTLYERLPREIDPEPHCDHGYGAGC